MPVIRSNNDDLRKFLFDKQYVVVKFDTMEDCPVCIELVPIFEHLSDEYTDMVFVTMNSEDNPTAKQLILRHKKPFVGVYKEGLLVECKIISSEKDLISMLDKLPNIKIDL
jgi:thiol-disulfide isomerase/thioredoxin